MDFIRPADISLFQVSFSPGYSGLLSRSIRQIKVGSNWDEREKIFRYSQSHLNLRISKHVQELPGRSHSQHSSQSLDTVWLQPCGLSPGADGQPVQGRAGAPVSAGQCRVLEAGRASPRPPAVRPPARPRPLDAARKDLFDHILISELLPALTFS